MLYYELCKALYDRGILQRWMMGEQLQYQNDSGYWRDLTAPNIYTDPKRYRILEKKYRPLTPQEFTELMVNETVITNGVYEYKVVSVHREGVKVETLCNKMVYPTDEKVYPFEQIADLFTFTDGSKLQKEILT